MTQLVESIVVVPEVVDKKVVAEVSLGADILVPAVADTLVAEVVEGLELVLASDPLIKQSGTPNSIISNSYLIGRHGGRRHWWRWLVLYRRKIDRVQEQSCKISHTLGISSSRSIPMSGI